MVAGKAGHFHEAPTLARQEATALRLHTPEGWSSPTQKPLRSTIRDGQHSPSRSAEPLRHWQAAFVCAVAASLGVVLALWRRAVQRERSPLHLLAALGQADAIESTPTQDPQPAPPALYRLVREHRAHLVAAFGGQGTLLYWGELRELSADPRVSHFVHAMLDTLQLSAQSMGLSDAQWALAFPKGYTVREWLTRDAAPAPDVLSLSPISYPLIALCQLARVQLAAAESTLPFEAYLQQFSAAFGHSQGVATALVLGMSTNQSEFEEHARQMCVYLLHHGVQSYLWYRQLLGGDEPLAGTSPMMAVTRMQYHEVAELLTEFNATLDSPTKHLEIVVWNGPRLGVVGGLPPQLVAFRDLVEARFKSRSIFLPISCPFHHSVMAPAVDRLMSDIDRLGLLAFLRTKRLVRRVHGTEGGELVKDGPDLVRQFLAMQIMWQSNWVRCAEAVGAAAAVSPAPTYVVDFGPGG
eukprot:EG_transcript_9485